MILAFSGCHPAATAAPPKQAIILLHGFNQSVEGVVKMTGMDRLSQRGIRVVELGGGGSWDAGVCCGQAAATHRDDVSLIASEVGILKGQGYQVNLVGFSNGGMMAYRYACERGGVNSVTTVGGPLITSPCNTSFRVLHIHGIYDHTVPYKGGYSPYTKAHFLPTAIEWRRAPHAQVHIRPFDGDHVWPIWATELTYRWITRGVTSLTDRWNTRGATS
jgi:poly(3-hydroxybutyrate) depolymerase